MDDDFGGIRLYRYRSRWRAENVRQIGSHPQRGDRGEVWCAGVFEASTDDTDLAGQTLAQLVRELGDHERSSHLQQPCVHVQCRANKAQSHRGV